MGCMRQFWAWARLRLVAAALGAVVTARPAVGQRFEFSARRHACGVCREVQRGLGCERFGACHVVNASAAAGGCGAFCGAAAWPRPRAGHDSPDVRVTKGFGTKGYEQVRVSVVSDSSWPPKRDFFDYSERFAYKWTDNYLHTAMKAAKPGSSAHFDVGADISVWLPRQGAGVAAVLIADPCLDTDNGYVTCEYAHQLQTNTRTVALLNAFVPDRDTDFWGILGDNFYDRYGDISKDVFSDISLETKSKIFVSVPGNHDYWVFGSPYAGSEDDQCGNGFMQFYAQDAKAAEHVTAGDSSTPFDLSVDPDRAVNARYGGCSPAALPNMFWYNQIGNVGLVGQSGAYGLDDARPFMEEACGWLAQQQGLQVVVLVGHWDVGGDGADDDMAMPGWYGEMKDLKGCDKFHENGMLKYVMGHTHCNDPHPRGGVDTGFRVGGFGMEGCGNYGVPILDTTDGRVRFWYFDTSDDDSYGAVMDCVQHDGWRHCADKHAVLWLDQPLAASPAEAGELVV